ncbi:hypothetical protein SSX86_009281 [Deinandra increscens subsp. villosa]|uniref:Uncharacterized protein n=1 Tax=Deinandra increscens subsp. villosa TaxID=3103831 RepID=A0AAP0DE97_9ASTR
MTKDRWLQSAMTNDALVAELLLRIKHSSDLDSDSDSLRTPPPPPPPVTTTRSITAILPPGWGHRKNRSKSAALTTAVTAGYGKEQHRGSPTTHLSWSGGAGSGSTSEESSRPSDLSSGCRSVKANEGASISSCHNPEKRKEPATIRVNLDQSRENLTRMKMRKMRENEQERGFVLPDLNMAPDEEDLSTMMR